jgi:hypothetical protein
MNSNNDGMRTDVLDDDGAPYAAEQRHPTPAPPVGDGEAKSPGQVPVANARGQRLFATQRLRIWHSTTPCRSARHCGTTE